MRTYRRGKERKGDGHSHHKAKPVCTENSILIDYVTESPKEVDAAGIIPCSDLPQTSNNIIQKGLAFAREQSGSVTVPGTRRASGSCPAGCMAKVGLRWWRQMMPHQRNWRIPMARLTDTQLIILSAASQRDDRGVELPANLKGEAARKVVATLIRVRLLEEVRAGGALPV